MDIAKSILARFGFELFNRRAYRFTTHHGSLRHLLYFHDLFNQVADVEGAVVECGVGHGHSLIQLCHCIEYEGRGRIVFGCDSFEGFPEPTGQDNGPRRPALGEWKVATPELIAARLRSIGGFSQDVLDRVVLVKGFFDSTLSEKVPDRIALLHLDVDLHESYRICLESLWPSVVSGGIVAFDEYKNTASTWPGAVSAIDEFLELHKLDIRFSASSNRYYLVKP